MDHRATKVGAAHIRSPRRIGKTDGCIGNEYWADDEDYYILESLAVGITAMQTLLGSAMTDENVNEREPPQSAGFVPERLLDSDEAAAIIQIHPKTLQRFARKGQIKGVHIGKLWRFRLSAIEQWIDRQTGT